MFKTIGSAFVIFSTVFVLAATASSDTVACLEPVVLEDEFHTFPVSPEGGTYEVTATVVHAEDNHQDSTAGISINGYPPVAVGQNDGKFTDEITLDPGEQLVVFSNIGPLEVTVCELGRVASDSAELDDVPVEIGQAVTTVNSRSGHETPPDVEHKPAEPAPPVPGTPRFTG